MKRKQFEHRLDCLKVPSEANLLAEVDKGETNMDHVREAKNQDAAMRLSVLPRVSWATCKEEKVVMRRSISTSSSCNSCPNLAVCLRTGLSEHIDDTTQIVSMIHDLVEFFFSTTAAFDEPLRACPFLRSDGRLSFPAPQH
jgi:hypothetical protein